jgi:hypothetical protein
VIGSQRLLSKSPESFGACRQVRLLPTPFIKLLDEFLIDPDPDLGISRHC